MRIFADVMSNGLFAMQLRLRISDVEVMVFREKWGAMTMGIALGLTCIGFGVCFYLLAADQAGGSRIFLAAFCTIFVLVGLAVLWRLPKQTRQMFHDDGMRVLTADHSGIGVSALPGSPTVRLVWKAVDEVLLAERLKLVEGSETTYTWRTLVIFMDRAELDGLGWMERLNSAITTFGDGRPFLLCDYPRGQGPALQAALRRFAPAGVPVHLKPRVTFDSRADKHPLGQ